LFLQGALAFYAMKTAMKASKKINTAPAMGSTYGILCTMLSTTSTGWSEAGAGAEVVWFEWLDMVFLSKGLGIFYNMPSFERRQQHKRCG
jgi:hypothetical protein